MFQQQNIVLPKVTQRLPEMVLVNVLPQETRVAIDEGGTICEIHIERSQARSLVGNIYLGVVRRILPGMQSAFIDIGLERSAFLHVVDVTGQKYGQNDPRGIEQMLFEGQIIAVQVIKDAVGDKGARLTTRLSLAGRFLVLLPNDGHINISQRIEDEDERQALKQRLTALLPENHPHGYILRTNAERASDQALLADIHYLMQRWQRIVNDSKTAAAQSLLYQELPLYLRVLRDLFDDDTQRIVVDHQEAYLSMRQFANQYVEKAIDKIELFSETTPIFEYYPVESAIQRALSSRVNLRFGGYLIIEPTEAMTTIDVNTGGFVGHHNFEETILKANLEACYAIARQLRLRNIGGMILVDFIDMVNPEHQRLVLEELAKALAEDRTRVTLSGFTSLGLVEITRKRSRESLHQLLCESCPYCHGRGRVKTLQTLCYEIMRGIMRAALQTDRAECRILAAPAVVEMFIDEEAASLAQLSKTLGKAILLTAESSYTQEQYDIFWS